LKAKTNRPLTGRDLETLIELLLEIGNRRLNNLEESFPMSNVDDPENKFLMAMQNPIQELERKMEEILIAIRIFIMCYEKELTNQDNFEQFLMALCKSQNHTTWR
jgi:hypothetical protein